MPTVTRRFFFSRTTAAVAAIKLSGGTARSEEAQLVWETSEWNIGDFRKLASIPVRVKQVFDITRIGEGHFLNNVKNSLNGLQFGFGVPDRQIKIAVAMHGAANLLNYDDYVWEKYQVGEWLDVTDPTTGKPATRNIFYPAKTQSDKTRASHDPDNPNSVEQDASVQTLQRRGVQFLSCHTALEEQVRDLVRRRQLNEPPEDVVRDMLSHILPGVLVVASMVAAIALLQAAGHYTYITI